MNSAQVERPCARVWGSADITALHVSPMMPPSASASMAALAARMLAARPFLHQGAHRVIKVLLFCAAAVADQPVGQACVIDLNVVAMGVEGVVGGQVSLGPGDVGIDRLL